jgi:hypothetical protein
MSCPRRTGVLKSTRTSLTWPDTWLPTWTVVTAFRAPVADTVATTVPRSRVAVRNLATGVRFADTTYPAVARAARTPIPTRTRALRRRIPFIFAPDPLATSSWTGPGRGVFDGSVGSYGRPTTRSRVASPTR